VDISLEKQDIGIEQISYWLPPLVVDNREVAERHGFGEEFVLEKLGIRQRRFLAPNLSVSDMAGRAVEQLFEDSGSSPEEVEIIILVSQTPDYSLPHSSAIIQHNLGIPESAMVFDISLGCSGFVIGLDVVISIMERLGMSKGVLVTADAYSRIVDPADRSTAPLFGDAAAATLLSAQPKWTLGNSDFGSRGSEFDKLIVRGSGTTQGSRHPLYMDGRGILNFTRKIIPKSVHKALSKNGLTLDDVDKFVFHQANAFVLETIRQTLGLPGEKLTHSLEDVGNTTSSSIPIALRRELFDGNDPAKVVLLSGFGVGLSWSSTVIFRAPEGES
jgi:3-oxoacyl-[acyl-carrier-protein] synthase-3